jgi:hypothetical protein
MYSNAKGANLTTVQSLGGAVWVLDCDAEVNLTFLIGGQSYPVHPLDTNLEITDDNGNPFCFGAVRVASLQELMMLR